MPTVSSTTRSFAQSHCGRSLALSSASPEEGPRSEDIVPLSSISRASEAASVQCSPCQNLVQLSLCPDLASWFSVPGCALAGAALLHQPELAHVWCCTWTRVAATPHGCYGGKTCDRLGECVLLRVAFVEL